LKIDVYLNVNFFKNILLAVAALFVFNSCKNDLKINAPYKETPSIYAVLCPQDKIQIIRINKIFLGESDANAMAQVADSINYQPGDLTVSLTRSVNGSPANASPTSQTIIFRDSMVTAVPGVFNSNQRVYVTSEKLFTNGNYQLTVYNNKTKNSFTAFATSLDSVKPNYFPFIGATYPAPPNTPPGSPNYMDYSSVGTNYQILYSKEDPAKVYQFVQRYHYYDDVTEPTPENDFKNYSYADYVFNNQYSKDLNSQLVFKGQSVYDAVGTYMAKNAAPVSSILSRKMYMAQFFIYTSTQEYIDYLQFAAPSLNITQDKPIYSNFTDKAAIGIFTFRSRSSVQKDMEPAFITEFAKNSSTCSYKFKNATNVVTGCQ
jgi:hypothetical protein